jgi:uncharacterized membrane protein YqiK
MVNSGAMIGVVIILMVVVTETLIFALRYKKVSPSEVMIVTRKSSIPRFQFRVVSGAGKLIVPFVEEYQILSTALRVFEMTVERVKVESSRGPLKVDVELTGMVRITPEEGPLKEAYKTLVGKEGPDIEWMAKKAVEEHGRAYLSSRTFEDIMDSVEETAVMTGMSAREALISQGIEVRDVAIRDVRIKGGMA